jgi:hypothetical protein
MANYLDILRNGNFEIVPAYGRDYRSIALALADWNANKDFIVRASGTMTISKSACEGTIVKGSTIYLRYGKGSKVLPITI